jgi:hypothetical protein
MEDREIRVAREAQRANLHRRIALYRSYLRDGVESERACVYLAEILAAEEELKRLGENEQG